MVKQEQEEELEVEVEAVEEEGSRSSRASLSSQTLAEMHIPVLQMVDTKQAPQVLLQTIGGLPGQMQGKFTTLTSKRKRPLGRCPLAASRPNGTNDNHVYLF